MKNLGGVSAADQLSDLLRVVIHRVVVADGDDVLFGVREQVLPAGPESEWVVAGAEYCEQRKRRQPRYPLR
jgi:hypothetical protein